MNIFKIYLFRSFTKIEFQNLEENSVKLLKVVVHGKAAKPLFKTIIRIPDGGTGQKRYSIFFPFYIYCGKSFRLIKSTKITDILLLEIIFLYTSQTKSG